MRFIARHKDAIVVDHLNECMSCISIGLNCWRDNWSIFIWNLTWRTNWSSSICNGMFIDCSTVLNDETNISDSISMVDKMLIHLFWRVFVVDRRKDKGSSFMISYNMANNLPFSGLQSLKGKILKAKSGSIVSCCLFGVSDPKGDMSYIKMEIPKRKIFPKAGLYPFFSSISNYNKVR